MSIGEHYLFDEWVTAAVTETADRQHGKSLADIARDYGVDVATQQERPSIEQFRSLEFIDLSPPKDRFDADYSHARVLFTPVDTPIGVKSARRALRLYGALPDRRLFVIGGPASFGIANTVRFGDALSVWKGDLDSVVYPALMLLKKKGVKTMEVMGHLDGAELGATAVAASQRKDVGIERVTAGAFVEPPAFRSRTPIAALKELVAAPENATAPERLRRLASRHRLSTMMMAGAMARDGFKGRVQDALDTYPDMRVGIVWRDSLEPEDRERMENVVSALRDQYGRRQIGAMALEQVHEGDIQNDDDLHTAVMLQGLLP